jgi:uncharacterized protein YutE (UPF0331/DUF86 family)
VYGDSIFLVRPRAAISTANAAISTSSSSLNGTRRSILSSAAKLSDLPRIIAFRNILVHGYAGIDYETVWRLIEEKLPELLANLTALLDTEQ